MICTKNLSLNTISIYAVFKRPIGFNLHHPHSPTLESLPYLQLGRLAESDVAPSSDLYDKAKSA